MKDRRLPQHIMDMPQIPRAIYTSIYAKRWDDTNYFISSIGMPGCGKSTSLLKMAYELQVDPVTLERNFDVEQQVVFSVREFEKKVQATNEKLEPGKVVIYDEIEIDANARGFDAVSKQLELVVSTMRFKKNIIGVSLPHERQLLKSVRRLRNARLDCKFVNHAQGFTWAKLYNLVYDMTADTHNNSNKEAKNYFPRFNLQTANGIRPFKIKGLKVKLPPKHIIKPYKKMKSEFLNDFYAKQIAYWDKEDSKKVDDGVNFSTACEWIDKYKDELVYKGKVEPILLADQLKISESKARGYATAYFRKKEIKKVKSMTYMD
jgi:hypothetical protein